MTNDYRTTRYCERMAGLQKKKKSVADAVKCKHPKAKDMHPYIRDNSEPFKKAFMQAYSFKCAYCGASIDLLPKEMFEIDHFIYEKSFDSKADAGYIDNLVLACHACNRKKHEFLIPKQDVSLLYPDTDQIKNTFKRNEEYYIIIAEPFKSNKTVREFYEALELKGEIHRLDYLLMNMIGLQRRLRAQSGGNVCNDLGQAVDILRMKRNIM